MAGERDVEAEDRTEGRREGKDIQVWGMTERTYKKGHRNETGKNGKGEQRKWTYRKDVLGKRRTGTGHRREIYRLR